MAGGHDPVFQGQMAKLIRLQERVFGWGLHDMRLRLGIWLALS
ncbi:MAG: hypothetical protein ACNA7O_18060 [Rhodobacterales bacterium]